MSARATLLRALLVTTVASVVAGGACPAARADEPPAKPAPAAEAASAVARLSGDELAALRRRFGAWDELGPAVRERIAANVLRLRALTPEQRDLLLERARRAEAAGVTVLADLPRRMSSFRELGPDQQRSFREHGRVQRLAVLAVLRSLSPEARALLDPRQPDALSEPERHELEAAISAHWRRVMPGAFEKRLAAEPATEPETSPSTPPEVVARIERLREELRKPGVRRGPVVRELAMVLAQERMRVVLSRVPPPDPSQRPAARREHEAVVATGLAKAFPEAVEIVSNEVSAAAAKGRVGIAAYVRAHVDDAGPARDRHLVELLLSLERIRSDLPGDAAAHAEPLELALLRMLLPTGKVTEADVASFATKSPQDRLASLLSLRRSLSDGDRPPPK